MRLNEYVIEFVNEKIGVEGWWPAAGLGRCFGKTLLIMDPHITNSH